jgi:hypothetical protein
VAVKREVDPEQAKWVRQIFEWYAEGHAPRWIAAELNKRGIKSARGGTWAASAIYGDMTKNTGLLNNELYVGRYVWNRSNWVKDPDTGKRKRIARDESEWIVSEKPELRIVPDDLWQRVKARQLDQVAKSGAIREALHRNARTGAAPKYLFSGLLKCGVCGGTYIISGQYSYRCSTNVNRGDAACSNRVTVSRAIVEGRLLEAIKDELFTPEGIELFKAEVRRILSEKHTEANANTQKTKRQLEKMETEIANIMKAIKAGIITPTTKAELERAEAKKSELERTLSGESDVFKNIETILPRAVDRYRAMLDDLGNTLQREVVRARNQIKALVDGEVRLVPTKAGGLDAELSGNYLGLLSLAKKDPGTSRSGALQLSLVAGARNQRYLHISESWLPPVS